MNFIFGLITSSIVGSAVFLSLLLLHPITDKIFSKAWNYYCLLVPLVFLLGGTHIAVSLTGLMQYPITINISMVPASQEIPMNVQNDFFMPMEFNNLPITPVHGDETAIVSTALSIVSQVLTHLERVVPFLLYFWVIGAIIFMVICTKKYLQYRYILLHNAKCDTDIDCKIPVFLSQYANTPMLIGVIKPIIVLPNMHFSIEELNVILAHEMVHYRRKDLLIKMAMLIANAVHWFNPVVYVLNRQLNIACELSCDEKVVLKMDTQGKVFYGETILQVLKNSTAQGNIVGNIAFSTSLCSSKKNFKRRLISVMNTKKMRKSIVVLALITGLLIGGGGFAISNIINAAMPVYASEVIENDIELNDATQNDDLSTIDTQQNTYPIESQGESQESPIQSQFQWPLDGFTNVATPFGSVVNPLSGREEFHTGIDIPAPARTPILAAKDGYVTFSGWEDGFGNMVIIYHGDGYSSLYAHALRNRVVEGQFVRQGEAIADVGSTGSATGDHLHFEIRINDHAIDPLTHQLMNCSTL